MGAFGKERLVYHNDYVVHEELGFCRYLAPEFTEGAARPDEIMLEFAVSARRRQFDRISLIVLEAVPAYLVAHANRDYEGRGNMVI